MAAAHGPVILADIADSGAGGTAGDATVTFKTLLDMGARGLLSALLVIRRRSISAWRPG